MAALLHGGLENKSWTSSRADTALKYGGFTPILDTQTSARHGDPSRQATLTHVSLFLVPSLLLVAMPFVPSSVLVPSSKARSY